MRSIESKLRGPRLALLVGLSFLLWASGTIIAQDGPQPQPDPARYDQAIRGFELWDAKNSVPKNAVLFVGSSSIRGWATHDYFPKLSVINRGFGGSHISDVNHFASRIVLAYQPKVIVFYAGDNDIAAKKSPQRVADDFRRFVNLVHADLPNTRLIFMAIKPSLSRWEVWPQMKQANSIIRAFSTEDDLLFFADTAMPMLGSDGKPRPELFAEDGLHLSAEGYRLWTDLLGPLLQTALNG